VRLLKFIVYPTINKLAKFGKKNLANSEEELAKRIEIGRMIKTLLAILGKEDQ